jgi:hypothetical protein
MQLDCAGRVGVGGTDPGVHQRASQAARIRQDVPTNHSSEFTPVLHRTLETGIQILAIAGHSYLGYYATVGRTP